MRILGPFWSGLRQLDPKTTKPRPKTRSFFWASEFQDQAPKKTDRNAEAQPNFQTEKSFEAQPNFEGQSLGFEVLAPNLRSPVPPWHSNAGLRSFAIQVWSPAAQTRRPGDTFSFSSSFYMKSLTHGAGLRRNSTKSSTPSAKTPKPSAGRCWASAETR